MSNVVNACRSTWKRLGVERAVADEMAAELEADLHAAEAEGTAADDYVGGDAGRFAAEWAESRGVVRPRARLAPVAALAVLGAVPGAGFALFVVYGMSSTAFASIFGQDEEFVAGTYLPVYEPPAWLLVGLYVLGACFAYAGALAAVTAFLRLVRDPACDWTARTLVTLLPLGVVAALTTTILFSARYDFATTPKVVIGDVLVAAVVFGASAALLRLHALRRPAAPAPGARTAFRG